jgi:large subunit ribosomal protein L13
MKTHSIKPVDIKKKWVVVDATDQTVGRLASEVARVLRGKHKPTFVPHLDTGDNVIVVNAAKVRLTGNKWRDKVYYHHTGYMGGIKAATAQEMLERHPERIVEIAVKGMLPKNKLGRHIASNLRVYADDKHGQDAQKPEPMAVRLNR